MKKGFKKLLYLGGTTIAIGGIGASIAVPLVLTNNGFKVGWDYDPDKDLIMGGPGNITGGDLESDVEDQGFEDSNIQSAANYQASFFLYKFEQRSSLGLQLAHFEWNIVSIVKAIKNEQEGKNDTSVIENYVEDIEEIQDKIEKLKWQIDNPDTVNTSSGIDYDNYRFTTDYPEILQKENNIRDRQDKILKDYKSNFIKGYPSAAAGNRAWPEERKTKYNNASTDSEALDYLVHRQISNDAVGQFVFKINNDYRVEQLYAQYQDIDLDNDLKDLDTTIAWLDKVLDFSFDKNDLHDSTIRKDKFIFEFLGGSIVSSDYEDDPIKLKNKSEDKVYFLGNSSKDSIRMNVAASNIENNPLTQDLLKTTQLMDVSHVLINAKPNLDGHYLPWDVDRDTIKKLYSFIGQSGTRSYNMISSLFGTDYEKENSTTDLFIRHASSNSDGTISKHGALGVKPATEFVTSMVSGFGLGMILSHKGYVPFQAPENGVNKNEMLTVLQSQLLASENTFFGKTLQNQSELDQILSTKTDEEITSHFGTMFRNIFDANSDGVDLIYGTKTADVHVVISDEHGIHVTKENVLNASELQAKIAEDLKIVAEKQDSSLAKVNFASLFSEHFSEQNQLSFLLDNFTGVAGSDYEEYGSFRKFYEDNTDREEPKADLERIESIIRSSKRKKQAQDARSVANTRVDWYMSAIDQKLRNNGQLALEDIYEFAYDMAGGI